MWSPEQQQAFEQIKYDIVHVVAHGPVKGGQDVKNVLYIAARESLGNFLASRRFLRKKYRERLENDP